MRVLIIRNSWKVAGAELYYLKLADAFKKYHIDCKLTLITNNNLLAEKATLKGIDAHVVNTFGEEVGTKRGLVRLFLNLPDYLWKYLRIINKIKHSYKPDIVIFSGKTEKYVLTVFLRLFGFPVVWLEHGQVFTPTMAKEALFIYKIMSRYSNKILAEGHDAEINLRANKIDASKIQYLGSGIDVDYFSLKKRKYTNDLIVGFMATIDWEKGILEYLETAKKVCKKNKRIKFIILGTGPQLSFAENYIQKNKLVKRVIFVGYQDDYKRYLTSMSILLSPIKHLGSLSLTVMEAMAMGVVPIVTDIGGNSELVINEKTGYIFRVAYSTRATKSILNLFKKRNLLKNLSLAAREHIVNNFSSKILAYRWNQIFRELNGAY